MLTKTSTVLLDWLKTNRRTGDSYNETTLFGDLYVSQLLGLSLNNVKKELVALEFMGIVRRNSNTRYGLVWENLLTISNQENNTKSA